MTTYRVHYPLISRDAFKDFTDKAEAEAFRQQWLNTCSSSPYLTIHSWRRVQLVEIPDPVVVATDHFGYGFSAVYHGVAKRMNGPMVEVFNPRPGIISQYVAAACTGDGRVTFSVERGSGVQTYIMDADLHRRQTPANMLELAKADVQRAVDADNVRHSMEQAIMSTVPVDEPDRCPCCGAEHTE